MGICPNWFDLEKLDLSSLYMRFDFLTGTMWSNLLQPLRQACTGPKADEAETVKRGEKNGSSSEHFCGGCCFLSVDIYKIP